MYKNTGYMHNMYKNTGYLYKRMYSMIFGIGVFVFFQNFHKKVTNLIPFLFKIALATTFAPVFRFTLLPAVGSIYVRTCRHVDIKLIQDYIWDWCTTVSHISINW